MAVRRLRSALENLVSFLEKNEPGYWASFLQDIEKKLEDPSTVLKARVDLNSCFGGMGSLNDLVFSNEKLDFEFGKLCDEVFKENRLVSAGVLKRLRWELYEFTHRGEPSPRIKNAFAP